MCDITAVNWLYLWYYSSKKEAGPSIIHPLASSLPALESPVISSTPLKNSPNAEDYSDDDEQGQQPLMTAGPETLTHTPSKLLYSKPVASLYRQHSPLPEHKCVARTRTGLQCKLPAMTGSAVCRRHSKIH